MRLTSYKARLHKIMLSAGEDRIILACVV